MVLSNAAASWYAPATPASYASHARSWTSRTSPSWNAHVTSYSISVAPSQHPSMSDAVPSPHTLQPPPHSHQPSSNISISSPPPTPATSSGPGALLNTEAQEIVPNVTWQHKTIVIRRADGMEVSLEVLKHSPQPSTVPISLAPPITTSCWTASVHIERRTNKSARSR